MRTGHRVNKFTGTRPRNKSGLGSQEQGTGVGNRNQQEGKRWGALEVGSWKILRKEEDVDGRSSW
jgi:hypothetical protein